MWILGGFLDDFCLFNTFGLTKRTFGLPQTDMTPLAGLSPSLSHRLSQYGFPGDDTPFVQGHGLANLPDVLKPRTVKDPGFHPFPCSCKSDLGHKLGTPTKP